MIEGLSYEELSKIYFSLRQDYNALKGQVEALETVTGMPIGEFVNELYREALGIRKEKLDVEKATQYLEDMIRG